MRRNTRRDRRVKLPRFPDTVAALDYAHDVRATVREVVSHRKGTRINVVLRDGRPRTLRVDDRRR